VQVFGLCAELEGRKKSLKLMNGQIVFCIELFTWWCFSVAECTTGFSSFFRVYEGGMGTGGGGGGRKAANKILSKTQKKKVFGSSDRDLGNP
jgi:hypothetical protein